MTRANGDLQTLIQSLEKLAGESSDRVAVAIETGADEAFFVGTADGFVRLAAALLRAARGESPAHNVAGVACRWSTHAHSACDPMGDVVAGAECLVVSEADRRVVMEHFRRLDDPAC